jgi:chemotaxis protein CheC
MAGTYVQTLTEVQRDALREVANIGAGHAATALSLMTGTKIMVSVPTITVARLVELAPSIIATDKSIAVVLMEMSGTIHGQTILALPLVTARRLAALVLRRPATPDEMLDELERSALTEAANILAGAYLTALSEFLQMQLLPSPPSLVLGAAQQVLLETAQRAEQQGGYAFCVETQFMIAEMHISLPGYFLLLPDADSVGAILTAIRVG